MNIGMGEEARVIKYQKLRIIRFIRTITRYIVQYNMYAYEWDSVTGQITTPSYDSLDIYCNLESCSRNKLLPWQTYCVTVTDCYHEGLLVLPWPSPHRLVVWPWQTVLIYEGLLLLPWQHRLLIHCRSEKEIPSSSSSTTFKSRQGRHGLRHRPLK